MHRPPSNRRHVTALLSCRPPHLSNLPGQAPPPSPPLPSPPAAEQQPGYTLHVLFKQAVCVGSGRGGSLGADTHEAERSVPPVRCSFTPSRLTSWSGGRGGAAAWGQTRRTTLSSRVSTGSSSAAVTGLISTTSSYI